MNKTINLKNYLTQNLGSDIEAKGFYGRVNTVDDIHCLCSVAEGDDDTILLFHNHPEFDNVEVVDPDDGKTYIIPERVGTLEEGVHFWKEVGEAGGVLSIHNALTYDKPVIEKIWPWCKIPLSQFEDTYVNSKVQWFDRPNHKGGGKTAHSLKSYGVKFGIKKPDITDWETMDAYKLHRVVEDVRIQKMTSKYLRDEAETLKSKFGIDFSKAIEGIEKPYAEFCFAQENTGAKVDVDHIKKCIQWLDDTLETLAKDIEPKLPPTIKKKSSAKIGRSDMFKLLLGKEGVPEEVDSQGEVIKRYYKPHVNFTNKADTTYYEGFHLSYGESPKFEKRSEFMAWVKGTHPDTKPKEWNYEKVVVEGKVLDGHTCSHFDVKPTDLDTIVAPHTRFNFEVSRMTQHEVVKGYLITQGIKWAEVWNVKKDANGAMVRAEGNMEVRYPPNAPYNEQMVYEVKKGDPIVTSPKFGEKEYEQLGDDAEVGNNIAKYNTYIHRRRFLSNPKDPDEKGVMAYVREDGRVPCGLGNFMTSSGRSNQRVIVNLPSGKALYGKEMRKMIIAEEGNVLVGVDQKSSQLSIAAFIADNKDYYKAVASGNHMINAEDGSEIYVGESAHCVNARAFGLVTEDEWKEAVRTQDPDLISRITMIRDKKAKGSAFATVFGASGKKLGLMLNIPPEEGNRMKSRYLREMGLDKVIDYVKRCEQQFKWKGGFYIPVMGYWLWCKGTHVGVNYFCQSAESCIQKIATLKFLEMSEKRNLDAKIVLSVHDEVLIECAESIADEVGKLMGKCYTYAGKVLLKWYQANTWAYPAGTTPTICVDFNGGFAKGANYYDCH